MCYCYEILPLLRRCFSEYLYIGIVNTRWNRYSDREDLTLDIDNFLYAQAFRFTSSCKMLSRDGYRYN